MRRIPFGSSGGGGLEEIMRQIAGTVGASYGPPNLGGQQQGGQKSRLPQQALPPQIVQLLLQQLMQSGGFGGTLGGGQQSPVSQAMMNLQGVRGA